MKATFLVLLITVSIISFSQSCAVQVDALKGIYVGDCKKNKADGNGTAKGEDSYTGEFKNGYPDGRGKYIWKNGDWYEGEWEKGQREGQGTMYYSGKSKNSPQTGFWKKDKYIGLYEKPYNIHSKTFKVVTVNFTKNDLTKHEISVDAQFIPRGIPTITGVEVINGQFTLQNTNENLPRNSLTTFRGVSFPFRFKITYHGEHVIDMEIFEPGNWTIEVKIQL